MPPCGSGVSHKRSALFCSALSTAAACAASRGRFRQRRFWRAPGSRLRDRRLLRRTGRSEGHGVDRPTSRRRSRTPRPSPVLRAVSRTPRCCRTGTTRSRKIWRFGSPYRLSGSSVASSSPEFGFFEAVGFFADVLDDGGSDGAWARRRDVVRSHGIPIGRKALRFGVGGVIEDRV